MGYLANLLIRIGADTQDYDKKLSQAAGRIRRFGDDIASVGRSLTFGISAPLAGIGAAALKVAGDMEAAKIAFTTMIKSEQAAEAHLKELRDFAEKTPFEFPELVDASRKMQALGFSASEVVPSLRTIGNAVSALGGSSEVLNRVILALGQIRMKGVAQAEEMRQLAEAGIPAWDALAKKLGTDIPTAMKMVEARSVDAGTAINAVMESMDARFAGGMEKQAQGLIGMWSNAKDRITFTLADIGQVLAPHAKRVIDEYLDPMLKKASELAEAFSKLSPAAQNATVGIGVFVAALPPLIWATGATITNLAAIAGAVTRIGGALSGLSLGPVAAIGGTALGIGWALDKLNDPNKVDQSAEAVKRINTEMRKSGALVASLTHGTTQQGAAVRTTTSAMDTLIQYVRDKFPVATKTANTAIDGHKVKLASWSNLINMEIAERGQAAIRKATSAVADLIEAGKPWGSQLEYQASAIDDSTFKTQMYFKGLERLASLEVKMAEVDWTKASKGTYLETLAIAHSRGRKTAAELRAEANRLGDEYQRLVELRNAGHAADIDVRQAYEDWVAAEKKAAGVTEEASQQREDAWHRLGQQVSTITTDMSRGITDLIFKGGKLKDVMIGTFQEIGKAIVRSFIEMGIKKAIASLSDLVGSIGSVGKAINSVFGVTSNAVSGVASAAGGAASAAGSVGGAAASAISTGVTGWVGAIGSVVDSVFSGLSYFQGRRVEKDVGRIEVTSRGILAQSISLQGTLNQWMPYLGGIQNRLDSLLSAGLNVTTAPVPAFAGGTMNLNISGNTFVGKDPSVVDWIAEEVVRRLRNAGLKF